LIWNSSDGTAPSLASCNADYPCTVVSLARIGMLSCDLFAEEASYVAGSASARRREFAAARTLARCSMQALGFARQPITRHPNRSPAWPPGLVGSLSHCRHLAVAAVSARLASIGIDVECRHRVAPELFRLVFTQAECRGLADEAAASASFSAKEAVFKAIHPITGKRPEFHEVEIALDLPAQRFAAKYSGCDSDNALIDELAGYVAVTPDHVLTIAVRERVSDGCHRV
jgi:4'-phosphopantetheinyl transferase EntD